MTNGHTFYLPISEIDKPEYAHLKDGRWVCFWDDYLNAPLVLRWTSEAFRDKAGVRHSPEHFSTHDPRPIGGHVVVEARLSSFRSTDGNWVEVSGSCLLGSDDQIQDGIVTVRIPVREPLKLEVTAG